MKIKADPRGFPFTEFNDFYGGKCQLKISSIADIECVWLGLTEIKPMILANDAIKYGVLTTEGKGWVDYEMPKEVMMNGRMHLTRDQVAELIPHLQKFVDEGII